MEILNYQLQNIKRRNKNKALSYIQLSYNAKLMTLSRCYAIFKNAVAFLQQLTTKHRAGEVMKGLIHQHRAAQRSNINARFSLTSTFDTSRSPKRTAKLLSNLVSIKERQNSSSMF